MDAALELLAREPAAPLDLAELALMLARDEYSGLDVEGYLAELNAMAGEAKSYVRGDLTARVAGLCRYLFHELGFRGNTQDYYDPRNSYLNQVLDRRTGIPISLSAVAMIVGNRAGLSVVGVGLPGHFIAKAVDGLREVIFDPYHGGRVLSVEECETMVARVTGEPFEATPENLGAVPLGWMAQRMLNNLKLIYLKNEDFRRAVRIIERLRQLSPNDAIQRRDLGAALVRARQPGKAIRQLEAYLRQVPDAADRLAVQELLDKARTEVARWN